MSDVVGTLTPRSLPADALQVVKEHLERIRFGSIALTIHDGKIVQLDITEKRRLA
jgi:hypothetical protein